MIRWHIFIVNQNIIQVDNNGIIQYVKNHCIYNILKYARHVTKTKYYDIELIHPIITTKCCFIVVR